LRLRAIIFPQIVMKALKLSSIKFLGLPIVLLSCLLTPVVSSAQWSVIGKFDWPICTINFTSPQVGFVGLGLGPGGLAAKAAIYKTVDGGVNWIASRMPGDYVGNISQILMTDENHGWAALTANGGAQVGLWKTNDGGLTWDNWALPSALTSIYQTSSTFIATDIYGEGHLSFDSGVTWQGSFTASTNCVDFVDDLHGVISDFRGQNWLVTSDGGRTWNNSNERTESWTVHAVKGTSVFYAAPEGPSDGTVYTTEILRSSDYGMNWSTVHKFDFRSTGTIQGANEDVLYVQTSWNANPEPYKRDFYRSIDQGKTWTNIGGPGAFSDSRFVVFDGGCQGVMVYASDSVGTLYRYIDAAVQSTGSDQVLAKSFGSVRVAANSIVTIPINLSVKSVDRNLDTMKVYEVDYTIIYDGELLDIDARHILSRVTAPTGWTVKSAKIVSGELSVALTNTSAQPVTNVLSLGSIIFDTYAGKAKSTLVGFSRFTVKTAQATYHYCTNLEGDYLGLVEIDAASVGLAADHANISLYPNPVHGAGTLKLEFDLEHSARVKAEVFDLLGRRMLAYPDLTSARTLDAGHQTIDFSTSVLTAGTYYVRFELAGLPVTKQFTVIR
jgi:photosystem II stability/assembly factor-like uncharacterized protein